MNSRSLSLCVLCTIRLCMCCLFPCSFRSVLLNCCACYLPPSNVDSDGFDISSAFAIAAAAAAAAVIFFHFHSLLILSHSRWHFPFSLELFRALNVSHSQIQAFSFPNRTTHLWQAITMNVLIRLDCYSFCAIFMVRRKTLYSFTISNYLYAFQWQSGFRLYLELLYFH